MATRDRVVADTCRDPVLALNRYVDAADHRSNCYTLELDFAVRTAMSVSGAMNTLAAAFAELWEGFHG